MTERWTLNTRSNLKGFNFMEATPGAVSVVKRDLQFSAPPIGNRLDYLVTSNQYRPTFASLNTELRNLLKAA
jgi:hypothetical protein